MRFCHAAVDLAKQFKICIKRQKLCNNSSNKLATSTEPWPKCQSGQSFQASTALLVAKNYGYNFSQSTTAYRST